MNTLHLMIRTETFLANCEKCTCWACLNNGECVEENGKPNCECPKGFSGNQCQFQGKPILVLYQKSSNSI